MDIILNNIKLAEKLGTLFLDKASFRLVVSESCTGGLLSSTLTEVPGSSNWFDLGFVTYNNNAKEKILGVKQQTLQEHGAVSEDVALEMAVGALKKYEHANVSVAITGIAGPTGGSKEKPVGTVWLAFAITDNKTTSYAKLFHFGGSRQDIRHLSVKNALLGLIDLLEKIK